MVEQMNDEMQRIWKKAGVAKERYNLDTGLEERKTTTRILCKNSHCAPPEYTVCFDRYRYNTMFRNILSGCANESQRDGYNMQYAYEHCENSTKYQQKKKKKLMRSDQLGDLNTE
jgi:hypothetical protein